MEAQLKKIACGFVFFSLLFSTSAAEDPKFPHISEFEIEFYETEVQITDLNQPSTGTAKEIYDTSSKRGVVDLLIFGTKESIYYQNETAEILEVNETTCQVSDTEDSIWDYEPMFYGWLNKDPLIIGPSAPLWYANTRRKDIVYVGEQVVRSNIKCDVYRLPIKGPRDDVNITFYFAKQDWTTPFQLKGLKMRIPIRIVANGTSSRDTDDPENVLPINLITDFGYFRPTVSNWFALDPPLGIGCPNRKPTITKPYMPDTFKYTAEVFDVLKLDPNNKDTTYEVDLQQVWYDHDTKIARFDKFTKTKTLSELYDFNTGVRYITKDRSTCEIKSLKNSMFEVTTSSIIGRFKMPDEVLKLDGDFYYMGKRLFRGIWCDSFEWADFNVSYDDVTYHKLVITVFYATSEYIFVVDGEKDDVQAPIYYVVTGYSSPNTISLNLQYNIFKFDDVIWPDMYESYHLENCFPETNSKSYFIMIIGVNEAVARKMEGADDLMMTELRSQITKHAKVSDMRIAMLRADYKSSGVFVTGLLLDRPPVLAQFFYEDTNDLPVKDNYFKNIVDADTKEKCAYACIDNKNMPEDRTCKGFHFCGEDCYLRSTDLTDNRDERKQEKGQCEIWWKSVSDTDNSEPYLAIAQKNLESAVVSQKFVLDLKIEIGKDIGDKLIAVDDIIFADGPSDDLGQGKDYDLVRQKAKLDTEEQATLPMEYVSSVDDCYDLCKKSESLACASFSFCPELDDNKQCLLTSTIYDDDKKKGPNRIEDNNCNIYSMKYLSFFDAYPGRISLSGADKLHENIKKAEECAKLCRTDKDLECRGFEYCRSKKTCALHKTHYIDLKNQSQISGGKEESTCTHYAAKFTADYSDMGYTLLDDKSDVRTDLTVEECAKVCSEELRTTCKSFNYCPKTSAYAEDGTCELSSKVLTDDRVTTTTKGFCHHYEKKKSLNDWKKSAEEQVQIVTKSGYTSKGFAGLVVGMLAFGLIIGAIGFVGYSYYRSRSNGDGMTVRFVKQPA